jgi:environmental stress-induced protein Ves
MVLTGSITLKHENHHTKQLSEFETDEFKGDWTTTSFGKCTDFNLMTSGEAKSRLSALVVEKNKTISYRLEAIYNWLFIYAYSGKINLKIDTGSIELNKGDLLEMNKLAGQVIEINGIEKSNLVFAYIRT